MLRRERVDAGDSRWGTTPFRIGLWVGASVAPNSLEEAERQITERAGLGTGAGRGAAVAGVPVVRVAAVRPLNVQTSRLRRRVLVYCSDPEGDCAFSPRNSPDEGLPVLTVDEEIYRLTPGLVIATVDKLAQLPWKASTATLFGLVDTECTRHGWQNPDFSSFCGPGGHPARADLPRGVIQPAMRLRPPDLIIQDELHLISGRARLDGGPVRDCDRPAELAWPDPARARRLYRDRAAGSGPGGAGVRARPHRVPAADARRGRDVLLRDRVAVAVHAGAAVPGHSRARRAA